MVCWNLDMIPLFPSKEAASDLMEQLYFVVFSLAFFLCKFWLFAICTHSTFKGASFRFDEGCQEATLLRGSLFAAKSDDLINSFTYSSTFNNTKYKHLPRLKDINILKKILLFYAWIHLKQILIENFKSRGLDLKLVTLWALAASFTLFGHSSRVTHSDDQVTFLLPPHIAAGNTSWQHYI